MFLIATVVVVCVIAISVAALLGYLYFTDSAINVPGVVQYENDKDQDETIEEKLQPEPEKVIEPQTEIIYIDNTRPTCGLGKFYQEESEVCEYCDDTPDHTLCAECTAFNVCTQCMSGLGLINSSETGGSECQHCTDSYCVNCDDNLDICNKCEQGFYWQTVYNPPYCELITIWTVNEKMNEGN